MFKIKNKKTLFFLILFFGLVLRLININQSLWLDEAISFEAVIKYSLKELFFNFLPKDFNPPLYYLVLYFWLKIVPNSEFFLRLPSLIFGLLTCFFIFKIYNLIFKDKKGAWLSLIFLITSPLHIYYSQEARVYSLTALLVSASFFWLVKFFKKNNFVNKVGYYLTTILMLYSHYLAFLILPAQWLYFLFKKKKVKKLKIDFLLINTLYFLSFIPWLPIFLKQLNIGKGIRVDSDWGTVLGRTSLKNIALLPIKFIIGRTSFENKNFYFILSFLLLSFFGFLLWKTRKQSEKLIWFWLFLPLFLGLIISFKIPLFSYFRFLFCLPVFYLLISRGIVNFKNKKVVNILAVLILLINLFFSFRYLFIPRFHREDWKKAVENLKQYNTEGAPVLILQNVAAPFNYYDQGQSRKVYLYQKEAIISFDSVWLIPYALPILDPEDENRTFLESRGFIRAYEEHFRGVTLERWEKIPTIGYNSNNEDRY